MCAEPRCIGKQSALCENKRAKIKFIDCAAAEANDAISAVGIAVEILEANLERSGIQPTATKWLCGKLIEKNPTNQGENRSESSRHNRSSTEEKSFSGKIVLAW